jgi:hypothetical protein
MVVRLELTDGEVDRVFRALADATRRDILRRTMAGDASVSQLAAATTCPSRPSRSTLPCWRELVW